MKVEKVMVRTIESNENRQWAVKACLLDSGVPKCLIEKHIGFDAKTTSREDLTAKLEEKRLRFHKHQPSLRCSHICSSLSFYEALKKIRWSNKTTMLMNDDRRLTIPFCKLQELLSKLPYDAKVFQPQWYLHPEEFACYSPIKVNFLEPYSPFAKGFLTPSNDVLVFTPEGAAWACEKIRAYSHRKSAGYCFCDGKIHNGVYTSIVQLAEEIGGQGYWKSGHGGH